MMRMISLVFSVLIVITVLPAIGRTETTAVQDFDKEVIREIVREYLLEHPEVIDEALWILQTRREAEQRDYIRDLIRQHRTELHAHPMSPFSGNEKGDITLVEFFDYQCGFCKRSLQPVMDLLENDKQVRIVWKEFPILGPVSRFAARAAMAAKRQNKYEDVHISLMSAQGQLTEERVFEIARQVGVNIQQLRRDMDDPAIEVYLEETARLAQTLGIQGTPAFVIGDTLVPGAVDSAQIMELVANARWSGG